MERSFLIAEVPSLEASARNSAVLWFFLSWSSDVVAVREHKLDKLQVGVLGALGLLYYYARTFLRVGGNIGVGLVKIIDALGRLVGGACQLRRSPPAAVKVQKALSDSLRLKNFAVVIRICHTR